MEESTTLKASVVTVKKKQRPVRKARRKASSDEEDRFGELKQADMMQFTKCCSKGEPELDHEMAMLIMRSMEEPDDRFVDIKEIDGEYAEQKEKIKKDQMGFKYDKAILNFKKQFSSAGPVTVTNILQQHTHKKDHLDIKTQYELFHDVELANQEVARGKEEKAKRWRTKRVSTCESDRDEKPPRREGKLKSILIRHGKEFGLKKIKKLMIENKHKKQHQQYDSLLKTRDNKEEVHKSEKEIQAEVRHKNKHVIKMIIEDNQKKQENTEKIIKHKMRFYSDPQQ